VPRAAVIYNPVAGASHGGAASKRAAERLLDAGFDVERAPTRDRRGAVPIAREVADHVDLLVVVGGDGSLREAIEGLGHARARVTIGLIPMGNANVVANDLGIPRDPEAAVELLVHGEPATMDVGFVRTDTFESLFLAVVGIGWDATAVGLMDRLRHSRFGGMWYRVWADSLYAVVGLLAALRPRQDRFRVTVDGVDMADEVESPGPYCAAFLCNMRTYAKAMAMAPDAHRASGLIHVQGRKRAFVPFLAWHLLAALRGRRSPAFISDYMDGRRIEVHGDTGFPVEIDGDSRGRAAWLEVTLEPGAVRILAPSGAGRGASVPS
jgi:diacylglycerol kinase (ATP)